MSKSDQIRNLRSNVPDSLKQADQWVLWKLQNRDGKDTKVPYSVRGSMASTTDPTTWGSFEQCISAFSLGDYSGIGFVFSEHDPFVGIDFDDCFSEDDLRNLNFEGYSNMLQSYTERSQSGTGAHIIALGKLPGPGD